MADSSHSPWLLRIVLLLALASVSLFVGWQLGGAKGFGLLEVRPPGTEDREEPLDLSHSAPDRIPGFALEADGLAVLLLPRTWDPRGRDYRDEAVHRSLGIAPGAWTLLDLLIFNQDAVDHFPPRPALWSLQAEDGTTFRPLGLEEVAGEQADPALLGALVPRGDQVLEAGHWRRRTLVLPGICAFEALRGGEVDGKLLVPGSVDVVTLGARLEGRESGQDLLADVFERSENAR